MADVYSVEDFMATSASDLMFLEGDEIVVLEKIDEGEAFLVCTADIPSLQHV